MTYRRSVERVANPYVPFAFALIAMILVYTTALQWAYQNVISPHFAYLGEQYRSPNTGYYWLSILLLFLIAMWLPHRVGNAAEFMTWVVYLLMIVPLMTVPHYAALCSHAQALEIGVVTAVSFMMILMILRILPNDFAPLTPADATVFWMAIGFITIASYLYIASTVGLKSASLDLTKVYSIRDSYRDIIATSGPVLGYLVRIQGNVINPLLITRGATGGRKILIPLGFLGQFFLFAITGYKMTLLSGIGILLVIGALRVVPRIRGVLIGFACTVLVALVVSIDALRASSTLTAIFVDRFIVVSGNLPAAYFALFSGQPHIMWRDSFLGFFGPSPYTANAGFMVGNFMTGDPAVQANSNYVADGYANYGITGIFIEAAIAALIIGYASSAGRRLPLTVTAGVLFTPVIALVNSSPITAILSNGFLLTSLLFMTAPRSMWARDSENPRTANGENGTPRSSSASINPT